MSSERKTGRPKKAYTPYNPLVQPGGTTGWLGEPPELPDARRPPGSLKAKDLRWAVHGIVRDLEVPVVRRALENILIFDHGFNPDSVSNAIRRLRSTPYLNHTLCMAEHRFASEPRKSQIFCMDRMPSRGEINQLQRLYDEIEKLIPGRVLGKAGERFARLVILETGDYEDVTPEEQMGELRIEGDHRFKPDLRATGSMTGIRYTISVKNQRPWIRPGSPEIEQALKMAAADGNRQPWLIAPFATPQAMAACERAGVRLSILGRRIAPHTVKLANGEVRRVRQVVQGRGMARHIIGPEPFHLLEKRTPSLRSAALNGDEWCKTLLLAFTDDWPA